MKGVLLLISNIVTQKIAKEVPSVLSNLRANIFNILPAGK